MWISQGSRKTRATRSTLAFGDFQQGGAGSAEDANGCELGGAQAVGNVHPHGAECVQAGGACAVDAGVGHDGFFTGETDLAAVGVSGKGELVAIGLKL